MSSDRITVSPDYEGEVIVFDPDGDEWGRLAAAQPDGARHQAGKHDQKTHGAGGPSLFVGGGSSPLPPDQAAAALIKGSPVNVTGDNVDDVLRDWDPDPHAPDANLVNLSVDGRQVTGDSGLPNKREVMPQFDGADRPAYIADLEARGINVQQGVAVNPLGLKPGQNEVSARSTSRLFKVYESGGYDRNNHVLVSRDGRVLDGNHRWSTHAVAASDGYPDATLMVDIIDMDAGPLIADAQRWTTARGIATKAIGQDVVYAVGRMQTRAKSDPLLDAVQGWPEVKPWNWSLDDVVAGHVAPLLAGGTVPAEVHGDHIHVDPGAWDSSEPGTRRAYLYGALEAAGYKVTQS